MERLDKLVSTAGGVTRKVAKEWITSGRITVDGVTILKGEQKAAPNASLALDGTPLDSAAPIWILLHKPSGYLTATVDRDQPTVMDLLPPQYAKRGLAPVGRLDKDTEGLLLLTDDGETSHRLLSPKYHVEKTYYLEVEGVLTQTEVDLVEKGLVLGDGLHCKPARLELFEGGRSAHLTLHEGKYHQIKRMMAACGAPVTYLKRVAMGGIVLEESLKIGEWRGLKPEEMALLSTRSK
ncbi:MAG: pseudouridine synthase [Eubacteriales bacterium]